MRRLMLLRHAKAEPALPGGGDFDRALAPSGREAAPRVGAYMAAHALVPDLTLCSPARRTRETWELAAAKYPVLPRTTYDQRIYGPEADGLLDLVRGIAADADAHVLLIVGHNPAMEDLAALLIGSGDQSGRGALAEKFPPGAFAVIDFAVDSWSGIAPRSGRFVAFVTPKSLQPDTV